MPDVTELFQQIYGQVSSGTAPPLSEQARACSYIFVPGFMADKRTFDGYVRRLHELKIDARKLTVDVFGNSGQNLELVTAHVKNSPLPVVIFGHSRGGMMVHDWYALAPDELKSKVRGLVIIQTPLKGTPVADLVVDSRFTSAIVKIIGLIRYRRNILPAVHELSTAVRRTAVEKLPPFSESDLKKILTVRSQIEFPPLERIPSFWVWLCFYLVEGHPKLMRSLRFVFRV